MGFNEIISLSVEEALRLLADYWQLKDRFLGELSVNARAMGSPLPNVSDQYRSNHLLVLGQYVECVVVGRAAPSHCPPIPRWLGELHDPIDGNDGLAGHEVWLGIATSYALTSTLLNTVSGATLAIGREKSPRYVYENQPVVKGRWYEEGVVEDISCIAAARAAVRGMKAGVDTADTFGRWYDKITRYARRCGALCDETANPANWSGPTNPI